MSWALNALESAWWPAVFLVSGSITLLFVASLIWPPASRGIDWIIHLTGVMRELIIEGVAQLLVLVG
jgi:hypothetical protein